MSVEGTQVSNRFAIRGVEKMSDEAQDNRTDILECLSVLINEEDSAENDRTDELILEEHPFGGTTLTAVTLPDGTQAFVANDFNDDEAASNGQDGTSGISDGKPLEVEADANNRFVEMRQSDADAAVDVYPRLEFIDGSAYVVTGHLQLDENAWEMDSDASKKRRGPKTVSSNNKVSSSRIGRHPCLREGCSKVYSTPHHLKVHERSHTGQRPYRCTHPKCKKSFSTGYSLKAHSRTHTGEKPYKCPNETCDKSFKTSGDLLKHVRTHTGERPFLCPFDGCGRSFTTSNIRKVHVRTHTGERPYKCTQPKCGKAFASATNYKNHIRIHSGEKPYVCSVENCGRRFTEYSSLYKHHLVHTQQRPFECKVCFRRYRQSSTLIMHRRTAHALIENDDDDDDDDDDDNEDDDDENNDDDNDDNGEDVDNEDDNDNDDGGGGDGGGGVGGDEDYAEDENDGGNVGILFKESIKKSSSRKRRNRRRTNVTRDNYNTSLKIAAKDGRIRISRAPEDSNDNETQILLVGDPLQIATLQRIEANGGFEEPGIDASFEELNIKIEDIELGWN